MTLRLLRAALRRFARPALAALFAASALPASAADPVFPPGASVGLVPPPGMGPAKGFAGFQSEAGGSIVIAEMPAEAYAQIVDKFTPEALRTTGFSVKGGAEPLTVAGGEGRLLRGTQAANGLTYDKWVAVVKGAPGTGLVTVQVPQGKAGDVPAAAIEASLRSIAFRAPVAVADQIAALPYTVGDLAGYRAARVIAGSTLLLTIGPKDIDPEGTQPLVIVAPSLGRATVPAGQEAAFARKAIGTLPQVKDLTVTEEDSSKRGGLPLVRLKGTAQDSKNDQPIGVLQTILFDGARYLRVVAVANADKPEALAAADRLAASAAFR